jgi:HEPN domain-containing protein
LITKRYVSGIYHTQQAAEKAFKAYLDFKAQPLMKTHNLDLLCQACRNLDADFGDVYLEAIDLNGLDTEYRYGGGARLVPTKSEYENAILLAEIILNFVKNKITPPSV